MALPISIKQLLEGNIVEWERLDFDEPVNDHVNDQGEETIPNKVPNKIPNKLKENPAISLDQMTMKVKVSKSTIQRDIKAMSHIVKRVGSDKTGHWEIITQ